tara:strand:- start:1407 stop:1556 length:150 start_codon:yes stop_codon:yes gene_type:complete
MNQHLEAVVRALGIFSWVFVASGWAAKSAPTYDTALVMLAAIMGVFLAR